MPTQPDTYDPRLDAPTANRDFSADIQPGRAPTYDLDAPTAVTTPAALPYASPSTPPDAPPARLVSLDAFRGLVMVLMVSAGLSIGTVVKNMPPEQRTDTWRYLAFQTDHPTWQSWSFWDLIQPGFMFMVGTAMAFSLASRRAKGHGFARMLFHALWRSAVLVALGVFFASAWSPRVNFEFTNVLAQIGLGYTFLFLIAWLKPRWQAVSAAVILAGYWALFALYPAMPKDANPKDYGLPANWVRLDGFAAHWEKNANAATAFDKWFLNQFPIHALRNTKTPTTDPAAPRFEYNAGGYQTLNFVPSLATMICGLLAGGWIRRQDKSGMTKFAGLVAGGAVGFGVGWALNALGWCPLVKRVWSPSFAIFSAGLVAAGLAVFYLIIDVARLRAWSKPLVIVGMNSIAIYYISMQFKPFVRDNVKRFFGPEAYNDLSWTFTRDKLYAPMFESGIFLIFAWAIVYWMYRQRAFIRI
ncbi:MAG TPA: DUF5009 domain-containing protein [Tepidisphaeraceae bacterium]|nr:DUF5009 domain-containing protein [Tepidisphaeraceae bacterium]